MCTMRLVWVCEHRVELQLCACQMRKQWLPARSVAWTVCCVTWFRWDDDSDWICWMSWMLVWYIASELYYPNQSESHASYPLWHEAAAVAASELGRFCHPKTSNTTAVSAKIYSFLPCNSGIVCWTCGLGSVGHSVDWYIPSENVSLWLLALGYMCIWRVNSCASWIFKCDVWSSIAWSVWSLPGESYELVTVLTRHVCLQDEQMSVLNTSPT